MNKNLPTNKPIKKWDLPNINIFYDQIVKMRDGVDLLCDVYLPKEELTFSTLLIRTPYNKDDVFNQGYAHPSWYVSKGYAVVCQDVRGRWKSNGKFYPFLNEYSDGQDTINWIKNQPWSNGKIGMYGFSYGGTTQMLTAKNNPNGLVAAAPGMTGSNYFNDWTYNNGTLNLAFIQSWAVDLAKDEAIRMGDQKAVNKFNKYQSNPINLYSQLPIRKTLKQEFSKYAPYLNDWYDHQIYDEYWKQFSPKEHYESMNFHGLHIAGWYDIFLKGTIENYVGLKKASDKHQMLVIGPWYHMPWSQYVGEVDFGNDAKNNIDILQVRFFDRWLNNIENNIEKEDPIHLFVMGINKWETFSDWPLKKVRVQKLFLAKDQFANSLNGSGKLLKTPSNSKNIYDSYPVNPHNPVSSLGGRSCCVDTISPMGPKDQRPVEMRNDVLIYDSNLLEKKITCIGEPEITLHFACNTVTTDITAKLIDVFPSGKSINISDGILRINKTHSGEIFKINLKLSPTANCFAKGHKIRIEIAGTNFPMNDRNTNSKVNSFSAASKDFKISTHFIFHGSNYLSFVELPVVNL